MPKLSVVIIAYNEERNILRCLDSVKAVADEIVVVDSLSTDNTAAVCKEFGCKVFQRKFDGYGMQKQYAVDQAGNDWIFSLDADEVVSGELRTELSRMFDFPGKDHTEGVFQSRPGDSGTMPSGYYIPFSLFYMGRLLRYGGVGNDLHLRIFNRTKGGFTKVPVHEGIEVDGITEKLKGTVIHYSYRDISHHLEKINIYTSQAAEGYVKKGRSFSRIWVVFKFPVTFFSVYFIKRGFLDGYPGFMWSFLAAVYSSLKIAKTIELSRKP